ncbi:PAS domain-containing protein [Methanospirillum purgamenti]
MSKCYLERTREFIVDTAESVDDALNLFNIKSYDAIISDYNMPGKNGIFFFKTIRSMGSTIPFIFFSGKERDEIEVEVLPSNVMYVQKGENLILTYNDLIRDLKKSIKRNVPHQTPATDIQNLSYSTKDLPDAIFIINTDHEVVAWNHAMERMTGLSSEVMIGKRNYEYSIPFLGKKQPFLIDYLLTPNFDIKHVYHDIKIEGGTITAELISKFFHWNKFFKIQVSVLLSETNKISGAIAIFREITQSKFLKLPNHQKFSPHKPIEIHSPDWIYWEGPHQQILYCSSSSATITGYTPQEIRTDPSIIYEMIHPDDQKKWKKHKIDSKKSLYNEPHFFRIQKRSGDIIWIHHHCKPIYGENGAYLGKIVSNIIVPLHKV